MSDAYRAVGAARGAGWVVEALVALKHAPGPYFAACFVVALLVSMPGINLAMSLLMPAFYAGLQDLLRTRESGARGTMAQVFAAFTTPGALPRLLPIIAGNALFATILLAVLYVAVGPEAEAVAQSMEADGQADVALVRALLAKMGPPLLAMLPLAAYWSWMMMLAVPRAMLDGVHGTTALREAAGAVWINLAAFVVNLFALVAVSLALLAFTSLPATAVQAIGASAPPLAGVLQLALGVAFAGAVIAVYAGVMHRAARDIFPVEAAPAAASDVFEA